MNVVDINLRVNQSKEISKVVKRARALEQERVDKGYRYIKLDNNTRILVECDSNGNPTKKGQGVIDLVRNRRSIYIY